MGIYVIKLKSGSEIIATLTESEDRLIEFWYRQESLILSDPVVIVPGEEGSVGAMPFSFAGNDENITITTDSILCILEAKAQFKENYIREVIGGKVKKSPEKSTLMM